MKNKSLLILAAALFCAAPLADAVAAPVTFWFSGKINSVNNPSNMLPAGISVGTPFSGSVTYDGALATTILTNHFAGGDTCDAYFKKTAGFSIMVQIAGHTILNATNAAGGNCGYVGVHDQYDNSDTLDLETDHADIIVDGQSTRIGLAEPFMTLYFQDNTKTAYNQAALPATAPAISQFPNQKNFTMASYYNNFSALLYSLNGTITTLSTNEILTLNFKPDGAGKMRAGWPATVSGFTLQCSTNLATGSWQAVTNAIVDTNSEHTATFSTTGARQFFRLKK